MIGALRGIISQSKANPVILFAGDVGYAVYIPNRLLTHIDNTSSTTLFIHTHVREDALDLFGFETQEDLKLFELLISVSGIGPKTALGIIDQGADAIESAVRDSDVAFFTAIPRVGKKNAQKIIIELKNKLGSIGDLDLSGADSSQTKDIIDALVTMGFTKPEVSSVALQVIKLNLSLEESIRRALKLLVRHL